MEHITQGALEAIFTDPDRAVNQFPVPVMQCLHIKFLDNKGPAAAGSERYRIVLSDVRNYVQCMLATQANHVMHDGQLQRGSIVRIRQYQAQALKGKNVMIILDLEVITSLGTPDKLGEPKGMEAATTERQNTTIGGAGFYGAKSEPVQESKSQVQRQIASRTGGGGGGGHGGHSASTIYPVEAISPYGNKWTIKVRVTSKSDIRTWHKNTGDGKLFSVNLLDETGEIRATAFNEQVDQFYDLLQEGQVYYISTPCKVQLAKKQFSNLPNDYEMMFERDTVIEKAEDQSSVPQVRFNFCNIQELQDVEKDATVDIIGVLKGVGDVEEITSKTTQKPYNKRELTVVDDTGYSVRVTVWGKTATDFDANAESIIAFKGMRVSDFGGRSLSLLSSGTMAIDPDIPEAHKLKGWYESSGRNNNSYATHNSLSSMGSAAGRKDEIKTVGQVKTENLGMETVDYFTVQATILNIKQKDFAYPACLSENCNKKVTDMGDGTWRCEKCDTTHERAQYRYIMSIDISDHTGHIWLSCFDEQAKMIMGKTADELMEAEQRDDGSFAAAFDAANCRKLVFRCRAKMDTYGEQTRVRYQVMSVAPIDFKSEGHKLAELIKQMSQM
ncbi:replication factor-a protein [Parathielavia hyrcaniae]|uniref:Replication protein A subunit n=1 Tax=Parathielavia hyrcaniae TaxID=113614 RepID=A0AAN6QBL4_9PEZI|nr:replication factor-a protein [Parathielavia hyrcaniae]